MSVQEEYEVAIAGPDDGLAIADRLATSMGLVLDWAGAWSEVEPFDSELLALFAQLQTPADVAFTHDVWSASMDTLAPNEGRRLVAARPSCALCIHWSPAAHAPGDDPTARWFSFVDNRGARRKDACVYGVELACNSVPLTGPDPLSGTFFFGPEHSTGWALRMVTVRDHMRVEQLRESLAESASVPVDAIRKVRFD